MDDEPRKPLIPPGERRQILVLAISGLSFVIVLALIALLLRLAG